jgi:uncharacterized protein (UPF0548 family)
MTAPDPELLTDRSENYDAIGATRPEDEHWTLRPAGYRRFERTVLLGQGPALWASASEALLAWEVKTRSGFTVSPDGRVRVDQRYWLVAHVGPVRVREPVRVVAVVDRPDHRGFSYGTLAGHPVSGEEAFVVHRTPDEKVWLTLRSLTRPPQGRWRPVFGVALVAQRWYRRRYLKALLDR